MVHFGFRKKFLRFLFLEGVQCEWAVLWRSTRTSQTHTDIIHWLACFPGHPASFKTICILYTPKMCGWRAEGETSFLISRQTVATMDDFIPEAPGPLLSHYPHTHADRSLSIVCQFAGHPQVLIMSLLWGDMVRRMLGKDPLIGAGHLIPAGISSPPAVTDICNTFKYVNGPKYPVGGLQLNFD